MDDSALISAWRAAVATPKRNAEIKSMAQERRHPVLKRIRRQLIIEAIAFTAFLFVYYDFFDGYSKPVYTNMLLAGAIISAIAHNIIGYMLAKRRMRGYNILQALKDHLSKIKVFAVLSVAIRALMMGCLVIFFASAITFNTNKYWILAGVITVFLVQLSILSGIWLKRIRQLKETIENLLQ